MIGVLILLSATSYAQERREESGLFRALGNAIYISNAADMISTELSIACGKVEKNPFMTNRAIRIPAKVVGPFVINHLTAKLYQSHPKAAIALRLGATCAFAYAASKNLQVAYSVSF